MLLESGRKSGQTPCQAGSIEVLVLHTRILKISSSYFSLINFIE